MASLTYKYIYINILYIYKYKGLALGLCHTITGIEFLKLHKNSASLLFYAPQCIHFLKINMGFRLKLRNSQPALVFRSQWITFYTAYFKEIWEHNVKCIIHRTMKSIILHPEHEKLLEYTPNKLYRKSPDSPPKSIPMSNFKIHDCVTCVLPNQNLCYIFCWAQWDLSWKVIRQDISYKAFVFEANRISPRTRRTEQQLIKTSSDDIVPHQSTTIISTLHFHYSVCPLSANTGQCSPFSSAFL